MKAGVKDFCAFLITAALAMAVVSSIAAITTGSRSMYIQTAIYGLMGVVVALSMAMRL